MKTYSLHSKSDDILKLQRYLNEHFQLNMKPDGQMGKVTQSALQRYQDKFRITERDENGATYGPITQGHALPFIEKKYIKESDYIEAAAWSGLELNVVKAVTSVEALGFGFFNNGRPTILFERHVFYRELVKARGKVYADRIVKNEPGLCNPLSGGYVGGSSELDRLDDACKLDLECALKSASYGLFQIMGFNHLQAGYKKVGDYYEEMCAGEQQQLDAFVSYVMLDKDQSLFSSLKKKDFTSFAREYNGPGYNKHNPPYDVRMQRAYNALSKVK